MRERRVWPLGREDTLEQEMATSFTTEHAQALPLVRVLLAEASTFLDPPGKTETTEGLLGPDISTPQLMSPDSYLLKVCSF